MGTEHDFAVAQQTAATPLTKGTKRLCDDRTGTHQRLDVTQLDCLPIDGDGGWRNNEFNARRHVMSFEDLRGNGKILDASVRAGAKKDLVDFEPFLFADRMNVVNVLRTGKIRH